MSNNYDLDQVGPTQNNKTTTINTAFGQLDAAMSEVLDADFTSGDVTLTEEEFKRHLVFRSTNLSTARNLTVFQSPRFFIVENADGTDELTVVRGSTSLVLGPGDNGLFYTDGTTDGLRQVGGGSGGATGPLDWKNSVRAATTTAGTLASDFEDGDTVDGVTLATGDRILIKDQASADENGVYVVAASGAPTRAPGSDQDAEVTLGLTVFVEAGTENGGSIWTLSSASASPIVLDTSDIFFSSLFVGGFAKVKTVTAGTYEFVLGDAQKFVSLVDGTAVAVTVPTNANAPFPVGTELFGEQGGVGQVTFTGDGGVTVNVAASFDPTTAEQYSQWVLKKMATDTWRLAGHLQEA